MDLTLTKIQPFLRRLSQAGFKCVIPPEPVGQYGTRVRLSRQGQDHGSVVVYYSPNRNSHTLSTQEITYNKKEVVDEVEKIWHNGDLTGYHLFVDGSFNGESTRGGWSVVIVKDGDVIQQMAGAVPAEFCNHAQVGCELAAAGYALRWCQKASITEVTLHYDYRGIEYWATDKWKANIPEAQRYQQFIKDCSIQITWVKSNAHSGDVYNNRADRLARKATK